MFPKIGVLYPEMDGENNGKPYFNGMFFSDLRLIQWLFLVPLKGGIGSIWGPPEGKDYKWYISGIYCQLGDYMLPIPPFRGTRNNH